MTVKPDNDSNNLSVNSSRFVIDGENIPFGAYQALYHKVTKKTERINQGYEDAYEIRITDLAELNARIEQAIQQYKVAGKNCEVSHSFSGAQSRSFSSFQKFEISDCSTRSLSKHLAYELNFLVILPAEIPEAEEIPQRYKISLRIENGLRDNENDSIPHFIRYISGDQSVSLTIEYADYAVALALKSIVDKWVDALPTQRPGKVAKFLSRNRMMFSGYGSGMIRVIPFLAAVVFYTSNKSLSLDKHFVIISTAFAMAYCSSTVFRMLVGSLENSVDKLSPQTALLVTKGDESAVIKSRTKLDRYIKMTALFGGAILTILLNIFSNKIYDLLVK